MIKKTEKHKEKIIKKLDKVIREIPTFQTDLLIEFRDWLMKYLKKFKIIKSKKGSFFESLFYILGFGVFLVALILIILAIYFLIKFGFPAFSQTINSFVSKT